MLGLCRERRAQFDDDRNQEPCSEPCTQKGANAWVGVGAKSEDLSGLLILAIRARTSTNLSA